MSNDSRELLEKEELDVFKKNVSDTDLIKASQAAAILVESMHTPIDGLEPPKDREEWLNIYRRHVWSYAGIFAIASTVARLGRRLVRVDRVTKDREEVADHDLLMLLDYPNPETTGYDFFEKGMIYLESCGNAYSEVVLGGQEVQQAGKTVKAVQTPRELWSVRPDFIKPVPSPDGKGIERWTYQAKKWGRKKTFEKNEILPWSYSNPLDAYFGLGSLEPAMDDLRQDVAMAAWNLDFFSNGMTPQGVFTTDQSLQPYQAKDIADQVREFLLGGRRVLVLGKNMKWQTVSVEPKDVDFLKGRDENRQSVLAALGVPPVKVGLLEHAKYDNYRLQSEAFHRDTILPKLRKIEGAMDLFLLPQFPDLRRTPKVDWRFEFESEELLSEDEDVLTDRVVKRLRHGLLTINEALEELGEEAVEDEAVGNLRLVDRALVPLSELAAGTADLNELEKAEDEIVDAIRRHEDRLNELVEEKVREAVEGLER